MSVARKVLVVEDDHSTQTLLAAVARRVWMEPLLAGDGHEAIALLASEDVDVILLDLLLPRVDGFDVLRHIRGTAPALLARVIVVTAAADVTVRECEELRRVRAFFRKPVEIDELAAEMLACADEPRRSGAPYPPPPGTKRLQ